MKIRKFVKKHKYILSFLILLIALSFFMTFLFQKESDYFWHVKAGEYMFKNNLLLNKDVFSWFMKGKYWMSHEWAFDYLIYLLKYLFGNLHLFIYPFICIFSLLMILFFTNKDGYLKNIIFSLFWIISFLIFCVYIQARPHLISFCFLALTIYFTYDLFKNENSKKIYFLPLVAFFWSNFHGGSSNLSYLFCLGFLVVGLFKFEFSKIEAKRINKKQIFKYLIVSILCMCMICINSHGVKMLVYPYQNIFDNTMINFISEWQPTTLSNVSHYPYFSLIVFIFFILIFSKKKIRLIDLALFGVSIIFGLKSIRFWGYTYIIMTYVVFSYVSKRKPDKGSCMMLVGLSVVLFTLFIGQIPRMTKEFQKSVISDEMISIIKEENPQKLYNMYDYGGELIFNEIEVFVDGRADLYSKANLNDYDNISMLKGDYIKLINKYDFDYFLVMKKYPINTYLKYSDLYQEIYSEKDIVFYKKKNSTI